LCSFCCAFAGACRNSVAFHGSLFSEKPFVVIDLTPLSTSRYVRRVGRPRKEWIPCMVAEATRRANDLQDLALDPLRWKAAMSS